MAKLNSVFAFIRRYALPLVLFILVVQFGVLMVLRPYQRDLLSVDYWRNILKVGQIMRIVHHVYVDDESVDYSDLAQSALKGMLRGLDSYSDFLPADAYDDFERESTQRYVGVGIEIERFNGRVTVRDVFENSPAGEAGMRVGDQIVQVGEVNTEEFDLESIVKLLRGEENTEVRVTVERPLLNERESMLITRRRIEFPSIREIHLRDGGIGYLLVRHFGQRTATEMGQALDRLESEGMRGLILDLRNNPGGVLPAAVDVVGFFAGPEQALVTVRGRDDVVLSRERAHTSPRSRDYPIVVLLNRRSASAAEIVAGALQDLDKAIVVGETSVGKGSVQSIYSMRGGEGLRMTTAKYYLPSGRTIAESGVVPDIQVLVEDEEVFRFILQKGQLRYLGEEGLRELTGEDPMEDRQLLVGIDVLAFMIAGGDWKEFARERELFEQNAEGTADDSGD